MKINNDSVDLVITSDDELTKTEIMGRGLTLDSEKNDGKFVEFQQDKVIYGFSRNGKGEGEEHTYKLMSKRPVMQNLKYVENTWVYQE